MKINFTKRQYEALGKTVYLGNWMANAQRTGQKDDPRIKEYEEIAYYIYSCAPEFGFPDDFEAGLEFSDGEEESPEVGRLHEEYDEDSFWQMLPDKLGERDFYRKYSNEEREKMDREEHFIKMEECIIAWEQECEKHGIERLAISHAPAEHIAPKTQRTQR